MRKITYMEMYMVEHNPDIDPKTVGVNWGCPYHSHYRYTEDCNCSMDDCRKCWNREVDTEYRKRPVITKQN